MTATVALEGFTHLISLAAGREIIRWQLRGLIDMTADMREDKVIRAGHTRN
jgi:hypothetical protein